MGVKVIQISDLHLFADSEAELKGLKPQVGVSAVLTHMRNHHPDFDHLVISGDHTHDELPETYQRIRNMIGEWLLRTHLVPGNHDDRSVIRQVFPEATSTIGDRLGFQFQLGNWNVIGLDSHVPGELYGEVSAPQWGWLESQLESHPRKPALLFLHHPPLPIGSPWMDKIGLRDVEELRRILSSRKEIRLICHGHIHQEFQGDLAGVRVLSVPSAAIQFRPHTEILEVDSLPPGYRVIELHETGAYQSSIVRVEDLT